MVLFHSVSLGWLRTMECQLASPGAVGAVPVSVSIKDFKGTRTAMFGKTRLGKSNVVKLMAQGILEATTNDNKIGQLIFDINGEYANDNPQDGNTSIRSAYQNRCEVYALTKRANTPSKPLRLNFYEQPDTIIEILASMLEQDNKSSNYIRSFASVKLPSIESIATLSDSDKIRPIRKIQMFWAILKKAGFLADESRLRAKGLKGGYTKHFDPHFNKPLRTAAYQAVRNQTPPVDPQNLDELIDELETIAQFNRIDPNDSALISNGKKVLDSDDIALLEFLSPSSGSGPSILRAYIAYHAPNAGDFMNDILALLDSAKTVILDLGNATDQIRRYFADMLSRVLPARFSRICFFSLATFIINLS